MTHGYTQASSYTKINIKYIRKRVPTYTKIWLFSDIKDNTMFPSKVWANVSSDRSFTTNACKSFHSKCNTNFIINICIIKVLKMFQTNTFINIRTSNFYIPQKTRKSKIYRWKNFKLQLQKNCPIWLGKMFEFSKLWTIIHYNYTRVYSCRTLHT